MSTTEMKRKQVSEVISYAYSQTKLRGFAVTNLINQLKKCHSVNPKVLYSQLDPVIECQIY